jgi:hypothetical protein
MSVENVPSRGTGLTPSGPRKESPANGTSSTIIELMSGS